MKTRLNDKRIITQVLKSLLLGVGMSYWNRNPSMEIRHWWRCWLLSLRLELMELMVRLGGGGEALGQEDKKVVLK